MSADPTQYEPKYVSVSDVPLEVEDTYSTGDKRRALFQAEGDFELDYNAGYTVDQSEIKAAHQNAIINLATYYLVRSATSPKDVTLGELADDGDEKKEHADQYLETYHQLIERLSQAGNEGQPGTYYGASGHRDPPISVNNRYEHRKKRERRRDRDLE